jgi:hypothetical protein
MFIGQSQSNVAMTRQAMKGAPIYDSARSLNREQEISIFHHYGRTGYWPRESQYDKDITYVLASMFGKIAN